MWGCDLKCSGDLWEVTWAHFLGGLPFVFSLSPLWASFCLQRSQVTRVSCWLSAGTWKACTPLLLLPDLESSGQWELVHTELSFCMERAQSVAAGQPGSMYTG